MPRKTKELRKSVTKMLAERKKAGKPIPRARPGTSLYSSQQKMRERQKRLRKLLK
ncbi:hypothetical protein ES703_26373 [subsurface metagenome]